MSERILVTGFKPFLGETLNPSEILLEHIQKDFAASGKVETLLLPVSFKNAFPYLEDFLRKRKYNRLFLLGQAGGRESVCFERVALNWVETQKPDEDGFTPDQGPIAPSGPSALFSKFPLNEWSEELKAQGLPVQISLSAGGYVCNHIYFKTLEKFQNEPDVSAVFIHVPYLSQQVLGKPQGTPHLELEVMKKSIYSVLSRYI